MPASESRPSRKKGFQPLVLAEETWGERFNRAFRTARRAHGLTYEKAAERISQVQPVGTASLVRLERSEGLPKQARTRVLAYLALIVYGFEPEDFGLNESNTPLRGFDMKRVRKLLEPSAETRGDQRERSTSCSSVTAA